MRRLIESSGRVGDGWIEASVGSHGRVRGDTNKGSPFPRASLFTTIPDSSEGARLLAISLFYYSPFPPQPCLSSRDPQLVTRTTFTRFFPLFDGKIFLLPHSIQSHYRLVHRIATIRFSRFLFSLLRKTSKIPMGDGILARPKSKNVTGIGWKCPMGWCARRIVRF